MMFNKYNLLIMVKSVTVNTPTKASLYICHHHIQSRLFSTAFKIWDQKETMALFKEIMHLTKDYIL